MLMLRRRTEKVCRLNESPSEKEGKWCLDHGFAGDSEPQ